MSLDGILLSLMSTGNDIDDLIIIVKDGRTRLFGRWNCRMILDYLIKPLSSWDIDMINGLIEIRI